MRDEKYPWCWICPDCGTRTNSIHWSDDKKYMIYYCGKCKKEINEVTETQKGKT